LPDLSEGRSSHRHRPGHRLFPNTRLRRRRCRHGNIAARLLGLRLLRRARFSLFL